MLFDVDKVQVRALLLFDMFLIVYFKATAYKSDLDVTVMWYIVSLYPEKKNCDRQKNCDSLYVGW